MLKIYTDLFNNLQAHSDSIRKQLGPKVEEFAVRLRNQPSLTGSNLGVEFEKYLLRLVDYCRGTPIQPYFDKLFGGMRQLYGHLLQPSANLKIRVYPRPSQLRLSKSDLIEIKRALDSARAVADAIQPDSILPSKRQGKKRKDSTAVRSAYTGSRKKPSYRSPGAVWSDYRVPSSSGPGATGEQPWPPVSIGLPAPARSSSGGLKPSIGGNPSSDTADIPHAQLSAGREITVTGHALDGRTVSTFKQGEPYQLQFRVGLFTPDNLASGDVSVRDLPPGGLRTRWVITSTTVEFIPALSTAKLEKIGGGWIAEFDLLIPEYGQSKWESVGIIGSAEPGTLFVTIYALSERGEREIYRELSVRLTKKVAVKTDETCKAPLHTLLGTTHEWTTPAEHIQLTIVSNLVHVTTKRIHSEDHEFTEPWDVTDVLISGAIKNVRESLESFREANEVYLNDLNTDDISKRLAGADWKPDFWRQNGWQPLPDQTDMPHLNAFNQVRQSSEWQSLASDGYALFDRCFPQGTKRRELLEKLLPGSRIDFHWGAQSGSGFVSHVPWMLMHMDPVDVTGQKPADPERFLGLRFRIGTRSWNVNNGSVALGPLDQTHPMHVLYWGDKPGDEVAVESKWQTIEYKKLNRLLLLPDAKKSDFKKQAVHALDTPSPEPVSVIYFYCHCSVGDGAQPCLRFGNTSKREDTISRQDLSQRNLLDAPIVFANACTTAQADPHMTSELEQSFFGRGVGPSSARKQKFRSSWRANSLGCSFNSFIEWLIANRWQRAKPSPKPACFCGRSTRI